MSKIFNVNGDCKPDLHYMVNIESRLKKIKAMVDKGQYFTINRARQYGKTTTLKALEHFLEKDYVVVSLDFQMMSASKFANENSFSVSFAKYFIETIEECPHITSHLSQALQPLKTALKENKAENDYKINSPWNIAADFLVDLSFSEYDIEGMLKDYEDDHQTGMDIKTIATAIYNYTSGYPFLVSRICQLMDERIARNKEFPEKSDAWTKKGFLEAIKLLLSEKNTLFESLIGKINEYPELTSEVQNSDIPFEPSISFICNPPHYGVK